MPYLIFDFDGTLADSFPVIIKKFMELSNPEDFVARQDIDIGKLRDFSSRELLKYLRIPIYKMPRIIYRARKILHAEIDNLVIFDGLKEVLQRLHTQGFQFGILTSNSKKNVESWLTQNDLQNLFSFIHQEANFFGKHRVLKKILKHRMLDSHDVAYIGDETRDIEAAHANGVRSIAVTWGFNSERILQQFKPDYIVHKPAELLEVVTKNFTANCRS